MTNYGAVSVGVSPIYRILLLSLLLCAVASPVCASDVFNQAIPANNSIVHVNQTYTHDSSPGTPWWLWIASGIAASLLFFYSLQTRESSADAERDALVAALAILPSAFFTYSSFAVDKLEGVGMVAVAKGAALTEYTYIANHTIYHFWYIGVLGIAFTILCIINVIRVISLHRNLQYSEREYPR